jgi:hypothetical protein
MRQTLIPQPPQLLLSVWVLAQNEPHGFFEQLV